MISLTFIVSGMGLLEMKSVRSSRLKILVFATDLPARVVITGLYPRAKVQHVLILARNFKPLIALEPRALPARSREAAQQGASHGDKTPRRFRCNAQSSGD